MDNITYLKSFSSANLHGKIDRLNKEQTIRVKKFIDKLIEEKDLSFEITMLEIYNDRIEISATHSITMI